MQLSNRATTALLGAAALTMFLLGIEAAERLSGARSSAAPGRAPVSGGVSGLVVAYAREHPDPAVSGPFAEKLASGEIAIVVEKPSGHAIASFGPHDGAYVLTIDPAWVKQEPTLGEFEDMLSIISHEHAHYRQYVEGEMVNYAPRGGPMTEAQCTLSILVEIDAHGKACRDAGLYGWTSDMALDSCRHTGAAMATYLLKERLETYPECGDVWTFYAGTPPKPIAPRKSPRAVGPPKRRSGAVYMPPP